MRIPESSRSSAVATVIAAPLLGLRTFNTKANAEAKDRQQSAQSNTPQSTDSQSVDLKSGDTPSPAPIPTEITKPTPLSVKNPPTPECFT